jgi:acetyltransferase-like isoleucine patch superfamily enzyme
MNTALAVEKVRTAHEERIRFLPWERRDEDVASPEHQERLRHLERHAGATFAATAYVADGAAVYTEALKMGAGSYIASLALVRGKVTLGANCTVNPFASLSGHITCGDGVRIASGASIVGFNHGIEDRDIPIYRQPHTVSGVVIEDDVWIGANAVILDGAHIGKGAVIAAGAVVNANIPPFAIAGGVPARVLRYRGMPKVHANTSHHQTGSLQTRLERLGERAQHQWPEILAAHRVGDDYLSLAADGEKRPSLRHLCDAIEIAAGFGAAQASFDLPKTIARLQSAQDEETGLFPDPHRMRDPRNKLQDDPIALYNVLAAGYALECLGSHPSRAISAVELEAAELCDWLESLPWTNNAWGAGAVVDAIGTGLYFNARYFKSGRAREVLFGWLALNVDRNSGLWGKPTAETGLLLPVNGFYRATRGTYAQFGILVPRPEAAINSVLANYKAADGFSGSTYTACNLLDTIHPLSLCLGTLDHRREEAEAVAADIIARANARWRDGKGFAFADGQAESLQGTEMWLSTIHLAARLLRLEGAFPYTPKGVHRTSIAGLGL